MALVCRLSIPRITSYPRRLNAANVNDGAYGNQTSGREGT
ncbi:hypothetical protein CGRA01v4_11780 [Colletotrichum graminicola]|nr:hypothetical protein CGRA01v4_11780 [Colletotrichum graminicola]